MKEKKDKKVSPPSKGGEMYQAYIQYFTFCFELNSLTILLVKSLSLGRGI
jgi:hypothetical protein